MPQRTFTITELSERYAALPLRADPTHTAAEHHAYTVAGVYYRRKAAQLIAQYRLSVALVPQADPYPSAEYQTADILQRGTFRVSTLYCDHPLWDPFTNYAYRIVHDVQGHTPTRPEHGGETLPFTVQGEIRAWSRQRAYMYDDAAHQDRTVSEAVLRVAFSETVLQLAYAATTGDFRLDQPVTLCPDLSADTLRRMTIVDDRTPAREA